MFDDNLKSEEIFNDSTFELNALTILVRCNSLTAVAAAVRPSGALSADIAVEKRERRDQFKVNSSISQSEESCDLVMA